MVKGVEAESQHEEERKLDHDQRRIEHQSFLAVPLRLAPEEPLDEELVGAVRCHGKKRTPEDPAEKRVGGGQKFHEAAPPVHVEYFKLVRSSCGRERRDVGPAGG